jgi:hypothetical protein
VKRASQIPNLRDPFRAPEAPHSRRAPPTSASRPFGWRRRDPPWGRRVRDIAKSLLSHSARCRPRTPAPSADAPIYRRSRDWQSCRVARPSYGLTLRVSPLLPAMWGAPAHFQAPQGRLQALPYSTLRGPPAAPSQQGSARSQQGLAPSRQGSARSRPGRRPGRMPARWLGPYRYPNPL